MEVMDSNSILSRVRPLVARFARRRAVRVCFRPASAARPVLHVRGGDSLLKEIVCLRQSRPSVVAAPPPAAAEPSPSGAAVAPRSVETRVVVR